MDQMSVVLSYLTMAQFLKVVETVPFRTAKKADSVTQTMETWTARMIESGF